MHTACEGTVQTIRFDWQGAYVIALEVDDGHGDHLDHPSAPTSYVRRMDA